jgi:CRISPR-associated protein Cas1
MPIRNLQELPKLRDSLSYLYLEHGRLEQESKAVAFVDKNAGYTPIPASALSVLMLGPGTTVTHAAVKALADNGCLLLWTGEDGTRMYAQGGGETRKAYHLLRQAELAGDRDKRLAVVRRMYEIRFAEPLDPGLTLEQVRGREGVRVREAYRQASEEFGVEWKGRRYDRNNWSNSDPINRALSLANGLLNGLCHAAIVSGGYSPALGFIHTGKQLSFVYDIADMYKAEITIPVAFWAVSLGTQQLDKRVRQGCREAFKSQRLLKRILPDIDRLLEIGDLLPDDTPDPDLDPAAPTPWWEPED